MQFRIPIDIPEQEYKLTPSSRVLLLGSCFSEGVGERLTRALPPNHVLANPFGVLYNPASIARALTCVLDGAIPDDAFFEGKDQMWHSWLHAGEFSATERADCEQKTAKSLAAARQILGLSSRDDKAQGGITSTAGCVSVTTAAQPTEDVILIVTFGTSRLYRNKATGQVVANCHRIPAWQFDEDELEVADIIALWQPLLARLRDAVPAVRVIFTVSPYRYAKYGLHGSQLSKARLHLAVDHLCRTNADVSYFASYEIILDELRDYRFFAADMLHPSDQAVDYVFETFARHYFSPRLIEFADEQSRLNQALAHRPLHPDSCEYRRFEAQTQQKLARFRDKWGSVLD